MTPFPRQKSGKTPVKRQAQGMLFSEKEKDNFIMEPFLHRLNWLPKMLGVENKDTTRTHARQAIREVGYSNPAVRDRQLKSNPSCYTFSAGRRVADLILILFCYRTMKNAQTALKNLPHQTSMRSLPSHNLWLRATLPCNQD